MKLLLVVFALESLISASAVHDKDEASLLTREHDDDDKPVPLVHNEDDVDAVGHGWVEDDKNAPKKELSIRDILLAEDGFADEQSSSAGVSIKDESKPAESDDDKNDGATSGLTGADKDTHHNELFESVIGEKIPQIPTSDKKASGGGPLDSVKTKFDKFGSAVNFHIDNFMKFFKKDKETNKPSAFKQFLKEFAAAGYSRYFFCVYFNKQTKRLTKTLS
jgi:hypothetical protein